MAATLSFAEFEPLQRMAGRMARGLCRRLGLQAHESEDFSQELLTDFIGRLPAFDPDQGELAAFALTCFRHRVALLAHRTRHGAIAGPFEAWLALRGIRTLHVRHERACANAAELARRLGEHPRVSRVRYPGWGAMLAIEVAGSALDAERVASACQVWLGATSLGGVESLIERRRRYPGESVLVPESLLRLSVGIEDASDILGDIEQALSGR